MNYAKLEAGKASTEVLLVDLVQLAVTDSELDDLLADGFDLEIVETPVIDPNVLVPEGEAVKLGLGFGARRRRLRIREVGMRIKDMQLFELFDPSKNAVKRSAQEYSQLHVFCITNIIMRCTCQNSNRVSAGFPLI